MTEVKPFEKKYIILIRFVRFQQLHVCGYPYESLLPVQEAGVLKTNRMLAAPTKYLIFQKMGGHSFFPPRSVDHKPEDTTVNSQDVNTWDVWQSLLPSPLGLHYLGSHEGGSYGSNSAANIQYLFLASIHVFWIHLYLEAYQWFRSRYTHYSIGGLPP